MERPDNQQQFTKTLPINLNNKSKKLMSQLWKEALMSLYMDKSYSNKIFQNQITNLLEMIHIYGEVLSFTEQTNPAHHPATDTKKSKKAAHAGTQAEKLKGNSKTKSPSTTAKDPQVNNKVNASDKHFRTKSSSAYLKSVKLNHQREEYVKNIASSIRSSPDNTLGDLMLHIITAFNSSCTELGDHHEDYSYSNGSLLHGYGGNPQPSL